MNVIIKNTVELELMAEGGRRLITILKHLKKQIVPGVTLLDLDKIAKEESTKQSGKPSFLGYQGYPAAICASVNQGIVHCIPDNYKLQEGDIVSIDFGFLYKGLHTDTAVTWIVGKDIYGRLPLLKAVYRAMMAGCSVVKAGVRVEEISRAIENSLTKDKLTIMRQFVGHGVGKGLHEAPTIPNFVGPDKNVVLPAGSTIAIEPIAGTGKEDNITLEDRWSVVTSDQQPVAHFEQTLAILPDGAQILTPIQDILDFTP